MKNFIYTCHDSICKDYPFIDMVAVDTFKKAIPLLPHNNNGIEICYVFDGEFEWNVEGEIVHIRKGEGSLTLPWEKHSGRSNVLNRGRLGWLILTPEMVVKSKITKIGSWCSLSEDEHGNIIDLLNINRRHHLGALRELGHVFQDFYDEISSRRIGYLSRVRSLATEALIISARALEKREYSINEKDTTLEIINKAVQMDLAGNWTLQRMSKLCGLQSTATTAFIKNLTGYTPMTYLEKIRIDKGCDCLATTTRSVTSIALDLGFSSPQHFATTFKKWTGMTPRDYRSLIP